MRALIIALMYTPLFYDARHLVAYKILFFIVKKALAMVG